jgi:hypothetical protein
MSDRISIRDRLNGCAIYIRKKCDGSWRAFLYPNLEPYIEGEPANDPVAAVVRLARKLQELPGPFIDEELEKRANNIAEDCGVRPRRDACAATPPVCPRCGSKSIYIECHDPKTQCGAQIPAPFEERLCTCHPDDKPPVPCAERYAFSECKATSSEQPQDLKGWAWAVNLGEGWELCGWLTRSRELLMRDGKPHPTAKAVRVCLSAPTTLANPVLIAGFQDEQ